MTAKGQGTSDEQQRAIETCGTNLLVSAAAGSGKTYTLVERIVTRIRRGDYDVDRLLVVTFTNAAASEMRERIEKKLTAAASSHPSLSRQLALLPSASISTIHHLCITLLRRYFAMLDLDPAFRVGNEQETAILAQRVVEQVFEAAYEDADNAAFLAFVELHGSDRGDESLYHVVRALYEFSQGQPDPIAWMQALPDAFEVPQHGAAEEIPWVRDEVLPEVQKVLSRAAKKSRALADEMRATESGTTYYDILASDAAQLRAAADAADRGVWDDIVRAAQAIEWTRWSTSRKTLDKETADAFKASRDAYKQSVATLKDTTLSHTSADIVQEMHAGRRDAAVLSMLGVRFAEAFAEAKKKRRIVDFNDLEHCTWTLLTKHAEIAAALRAQYAEIMVDECQDVNSVQEAILQCLANGENLFTVGDVKQSIYRFRLANPALFQEKQRLYRADAAAGAVVDMTSNYRSRKEVLAAVNYLFAQLMVGGDTELVYDEKAALYPKATFPPKDDVTTFDGAAAELLLVTRDAAADVTANSSQQDKYETPDKGDNGDASTGSDVPGAAETSGESATADETNAIMEGFAGEANAIARRVQKLLTSGVEVYDRDGGGYRPIRPRDIAVLLRSARGKAQALIDAFRAQDIPAYANVDAGYFAETEVARMLELLSVIDNCHQDIPLAAVLHSPMVGLTADDLARIRATRTTGDLYDALCDDHKATQDPRVATFLQNLARWRTMSRSVGVPTLLWHLYRDTGYYEFVGATPGGIVRQANLRMLRDRAAEYEKTNFRGLFRFLQFVRKMKTSDTDLSVARTLGENEDVVRVMTIHKSKGLEFPVVILADAAKPFNTQDLNAEVLMHAQKGLGLDRIDTDGIVRWRQKTLRRQYIRAKMEKEMTAEELRMLYVALTRAKEKLILVASVDSVEKLRGKWACVTDSTREGAGCVALDDDLVLEGKTYLDWFVMALLRHPSGDVLRDETCAVGDLLGAYDAAKFGTPLWQIRMLTGDAEAEEAAQAEDEDAVLSALRRAEPLPVAPAPHDAWLDWTYPHRTEIPAKVTVTEVKRRQTEEALLARGEELLPRKTDPARFALPSFLTDENAAEYAPSDISATAYGTLMHTVLEQIDPTGGCGEDVIAAQIAKCVSDGRCTEAEGALLRAPHSLHALASFWQSPIGTRVRAAAMRGKADGETYVYREQPFSLLLPATELHADAAAEDRVLLQGVIDLFFIEDDGIVLVDYKTDRNTTKEQMKKRYTVQLRLYARALATITGQCIKEAWIYRLHDHDSIFLGELS